MSLALLSTTAVVGHLHNERYHNAKVVNTEPNAVTGVEETGEAPDPDRGSNWLDEGRVAPDPEIWAVERRAAQDADSASIWTVEKRAAQDRDSGSIWTVEKRAPAIAKS